MSGFLLTGNDVRTGQVLWWSGNGWSRDPDAAAGVSKEEGEARIAEEGRRERVSDLALVPAEAVPGGGWRPLHVRERIRAYGPTVRPDLAIAGRDWR